MKLIIKAIKQKTDFILLSLFTFLNKNYSKLHFNAKRHLSSWNKKTLKKYKVVFDRIFNNRLVNRSVLIDTRGRIKSYYDKIPCMILF